MQTEITAIRSHYNKEGSEYNMYRKTKELREIEIILHKNGFQFARSKGSHFTYVSRATHRHITVNKNLNRMVKERLIKEYNLEV